MAYETENARNEIKLRKKVLNLISNIGGYYTRHGKYPLEFTVGVYESSDFEAAWDALTKREKNETGEYEKSIFESEFPSTFKLYADKTFAFRRAVVEIARKWTEAFSQREWEMIVEDMQSAVKGDDEYYQYVSPDVQREWAIDTKETKFDVEFCFAGRGGKHLCIESFEGVKLEGTSNDELCEAMQEDINNIEKRRKLESAPNYCEFHKNEGYESGCEDCENVDISLQEEIDALDEIVYSVEWLKKLGAYLSEAKIMFTSEKAGKEFRYKLAWNLGRMIEDKIDERERHNAARS